MKIANTELDIEIWEGVTDTAPYSYRAHRSFFARRAVAVFVAGASGALRLRVFAASDAPRGVLAAPFVRAGAGFWP
jgi:hypothetical protein